jgi:predicted permease
MPSSRPTFSPRTDCELTNAIALGLVHVNDVRSAHSEYGATVDLMRVLSGWCERRLQDGRFAVRSLSRTPIFSISVALTLALGIGANTALFSIVERFFLEGPGGVDAPHQVRRVVLHFLDPRHAQRTTATIFNFPEYRSLAGSLPIGFRTAAYFVDNDAPLGGERHAGSGVVSYVIDDYFGVLGVHPVIGRMFRDDEYGTRAVSPVAVISTRYWRSHFGLSPQIIGKQIDVGSHQITVVGVAPEAFNGVDLDAVDVWLPRNTLGSWENWSPKSVESPMQVSLHALVRIPPTAGANTQGEVSATAVLRNIGMLRDSTATATFESLRTAVDLGAQGKEAQMSVRLADVALLILIIACANVANLLLVRTMQRNQEIATRVALGAGRSRLIAQALTESVLLAGVGGAAALVCAEWFAPLLSHALLPNVRWESGHLGVSAFLFASLLVVVTGVVTGIAPAIHASQSDLARALRGNPGGPASFRAGARSTMLAAQVAFAVVLLASAVLVVQSLRNVEAIDTGYEASRLSYAEVIPDMTFSSHDAEMYRTIGAMLPEIAQRIARVPGVEATALAESGPLQLHSMYPVFLPNLDSTPTLNRLPPLARIVSPEFFNVAGLRLLEGRPLLNTDREGSAPVVVVSRIMAQTLWPGERALDKCVIVWERQSPCRRVVGVVSDTHYRSIFELPAMQLYLPFAQADSASRNPGAILIRSRTGDLTHAATGALQVVSEMTGTMGSPRVRTIAQMLDPVMHPWRLAADLFGAAALLALLVAAIGIYGTVAYTVSQQRHEMGVRLALGAPRVGILRLVVIAGLRVVGIGLGLGLLMVLALGRVLSSMLYGTTSHDPLILGIVAMLIGATATLACLVPAWQAARVDPATLLRNE